MIPLSTARRMSSNVAELNFIFEWRVYSETSDCIPNASKESFRSVGGPYM